VRIVHKWEEYAECRQTMEYLDKKVDGKEFDTVEFEWVACTYVPRQEEKESFWAGAFGVGPLKFHQRKEKRRELYQCFFI